MENYSKEAIKYIKERRKIPRPFDHDDKCIELLIEKCTWDKNANEQLGKLLRKEKYMNDCYNEAVRYINQRVKSKKPFDTDDKVIQLLIGQYNYGISAKKDLYNILLRKGIIKAEDKQ